MPPASPADNLILDVRVPKVKFNFTNNLEARS